MINAYEYGKALFSLAEEEGVSEEVFSELSAVVGVFADHPDYLTLLDTPAIPTGEKPGMIDGAFASAHPYVRDFLKILSEKRSASSLAECCRVYGECFDEARGILRATAKTAVPMTEAQSKKLSDKISAITGKTVILNYECDPAVIGGVTLFYDGTRFDGSVHARLETLRRQLSELTL